MKESVFREKSLDRISSPEEFDAYVKISSPGVWMLLSAIILLLAGTVVWGIFGRLDTVIDAAVISDGTAEGCYAIVDEKDISSVEIGMKVIGQDGEYTITAIDRRPVFYDRDDDAQIVHALNRNDDVWAHKVELEVDSTPGVGEYNASIVVDSVAPASFVWN